MLVFLYLFFFTFLLMLYYLAPIKLFREKKEFLNIEDVSLVIPFKNEENRIEKLISSLKKQKVLPKKILFVNDHSSDKTVQLLEANQFEVVELKASENGKKHALKYGISQCNSTYILTLDADVNLTDNYFEDLNKLKTADLIILPVVHETTKLFHYFAQLELLFFYSLQYHFRHFLRPFICSGANLLFKKDLYLKAIEEEAYWKIPSGDDMFLLNYANKAKSSYRVYDNAKTAVSTKYPDQFNDFIAQRNRWAGKIPMLLNLKLIFLLLFGFIYMFTPLFFVLYNSELWPVILYKLVFDLFIFIPIAFRYKQVKNCLIYPVLSVFYFGFLILFNLKRIKK